MTTYPAAEALRKAAAVPSLAHHGLTLTEQTLDAFADGVSIADLSLPDAPIIYVNPAFERISGYDAAELIGRNCRFLQGADRQQPEIAQMAAAIQDRRDIDVVLRNYRKDGTLFWNELRLCLLPDAAGNARYSLAIMRDVTAGRALGDQLYRVTTFDELTGLQTRRGFLAALDAARHDTDMVVLCCDTDQLRDVNGTYGRDAGDAVLCELANRLRASPDVMAAARLAAGQFALALRLPQGLDSAASIALLRARILRPFTLPGITVALTVTLGWTRTAARQGTAAETLLIRAEIALYAAKADGRGEIRAYDPAIEHESRRRLRLTAELRTALSNDELALHYQPKVEIATGRIIGMEALLRWHHPVFGLQAPDRFLDVAEESGLIIDIGAWALAEASRFAVALNRRGHAVYVAVNVSPVQFQRSDVAQLMCRTLAETGAEAHWVSLELTETVLAGTNARFAACFAELRRMGIGLAMDDFGTGAASMKSLRSLPFTEVKVDRSFVRNLDHDPVQAAMAGAALGIARALGMTACCEGIETAAERDALLALGCPVAQGYFFSLPLEGEDLIWLMDNHASLPVDRQLAHPGERGPHGIG